MRHPVEGLYRPTVYRTGQNTLFLWFSTFSPLFGVMFGHICKILYAGHFFSPGYSSRELWFEGCPGVDSLFKGQWPMGHSKH